MTSNPHIDIWPGSPPTTIADDTSDFVERAHRIVIEYHRRQLLAEAVLNIHDQQQIPWRARLKTGSGGEDFVPFQRLDDVDFSYRRCLSLHFASDFPLKTFAQLYGRFPGAEFHLPPLIVRQRRCHSPLFDEESELGIIVP